MTVYMHHESLLPTHNSLSTLIFKCPVSVLFRSFEIYFLELSRPDYQV